MLALKDFSPNPVAWCGLTGGEEVDSGSAAASRDGPVLTDPELAIFRIPRKEFNLCVVRL